MFLLKLWISVSSGLIMENPINLAPEDDLLEGSTIGVFPDLNLEVWESCHFNPDFSELDTLKGIVKNHGTLFQPFDREGLRVES